MAARKGKTRAVRTLCEQLKSWWNFCTQNVKATFARQFTDLGQGVPHVFPAAARSGS